MGMYPSAFSFSCRFHFHVKQLYKNNYMYVDMLKYIVYLLFGTTNQGKKPSICSLVVGHLHLVCKIQIWWPVDRFMWSDGIFYQCFCGLYNMFEWQHYEWVIISLSDGKQHPDITLNVLKGSFDSKQNKVKRSKYYIHCYFVVKVKNLHSDNFLNNNTVLKERIYHNLSSLDSTSNLFKMCHTCIMMY